VLKIFSSIANGANDSRSALKEIGLGLMLGELKDLHSDEQLIYNEIQEIASKMNQRAYNETENSSDSSDPEDYDEFFCEKRSKSLTDSLIMLKNSTLLENGNGSLEEIQKKINEDKLLIILLKSKLEQLQDETKEQEVKIKELQSGWHSNVDLVNEKKTLELVNKQLLKELNQTNEKLKDQLITTNTQRESYTKLELQITEKTLSLEATRAATDTVIEKLESELEELELKDTDLLTDLALMGTSDPQKKLALADQILENATPLISHWMNLAMKLNFLSSQANDQKVLNTNYDQEELFNELKAKQIPQSEWPHMLLSKLESLNK